MSDIASGNRSRRLLRAKPLEAETPPPAVPIPVPLAPIPQPIPVQPYVPQPVYPQPVALAPQPAPVQPASAQPLPNQPVARQPAPVQPQPQAASAPAAGRAVPILLTPEQKQKQLPVEQRRRAPGHKAAGIREKMREVAEEGEAVVWWRAFAAEHRSWMTSAVVHMLLLIAFALWLVGKEKQYMMVVVSPPDEELKIEDLVDVPIDGPEILPMANDIVDRDEPESLQPLIDMQNAAEGIDAASQMLVKDSLNHIPYNDILSAVGAGTGKADQLGTGKGKKGTGYGLDGKGLGMGGRGGRRGEATSRGASKESETAVDLALKWLAEHQLPDGSWSYDHTRAPTCNGQCPNPGTLADARLGATAMGVLPFLGAGHTNQVGKYQQTVGAGLNYLVQHTVIDGNGGRLSEPGGRMYSHGLAAIALCEAFAMQMKPADFDRMRPPEYDGTNEPKPVKRRENKEVPVPNLGLAAQQSLKYIAYAQDPMGGGWRYEPKQPGDTSVVGWQLMALMSGRLGYLQAPPVCFVGASKFLDSVQMDDYGADYGYTDKTKRTNATQAIGLLCRMYLGWKRDHQGIQQGVEALGRIGPQEGVMYYNYYATQVMHHFGGPQWDQWNTRMRDSLVGSQSKAGHTAGSWFFGHGDHGGAQGGRLYYTSLCALTLEVYYRHLPIFRNEGFFEGNKPQPAAEEKKKDVDDL